MVDGLSAYADMLPKYLGMTWEEWHKVCTEKWEVIRTIQLGQLTLVEQRSPKDFTVKDFRCEIAGLYFILTRRKLTILNSIHRHFKGNNHSDFAYSELLKAIESIENLTGIPAVEFHQTKFELAINIITPERPLEYLKFIEDYKGRKFDPMRTKGGKQYGVKCILTDYDVKIYDKKEELKNHYQLIINENILRFEIKYKRHRKSCLIQTLADFRDKTKLSQMFVDFIQIFQLVNSTKIKDFSALKSRERDLFFAGQSSEFWSVENRENRDTAKSKKKRFRQIQQVVNSVNPMKEIFIPALETKINELLNK